jgi:hypothetical protein
MESPRLDNRACLLVFCLVACISLSFDALHLAHTWAGNQPSGFETLRDPRFRITTDRGFSERFEYAMSGLTILILTAMAVRTRIGAYLWLAAAHAWLAIDNGMELHEQIGAWIAVRSGAGSSLKAAQLGELGYFAGLGLAGGAALWIAWRTAPRPHQPLIALLVAGLVGIGVFAVGADAFHASDLWRPLKETIVIMLEDGSESLALGANLAIAVGLFQGARAASPTSVSTA